MEMLEAISDMEDFLGGRSQAEFLASPLIRQAVSFGMLRLGEGANQLSSDLKARAPDAPWQEMVLLRHRVAHGYASVDPRIIWAVAATRLDELRTTLRRLLADFEEP